MPEGEGDYRCDRNTKGGGGVIFDVTEMLKGEGDYRCDRNAKGGGVMIDVTETPKGEG